MEKKYQDFIDAGLLVVLDDGNFEVTDLGERFAELMADLSFQVKPENLN